MFPIFDSLVEYKSQTTKNILFVRMNIRNDSL